MRDRAVGERDRDPLLKRLYVFCHRPFDLVVFEAERGQRIDRRARRSHPEPCAWAVRHAIVIRCCGATHLSTRLLHRPIDLVSLAAPSRSPRCARSGSS
jgi:hypothetical protein